MSSKNTLTKLPPAWHAEAIGILKDNAAGIHAAFLDATKRAVWLGIFLNEIKERGKADESIPHGQFGPWLEKNLPDLSWHQANVYMRLGRGVVEKGKVQIGDFLQFARGGKLPESALKLIEGKTQQQLCLEFKQMEQNDATGEMEKKVGRLQGEGPLPLEKRNLRKQIEAADEVDEESCRSWVADTLLLADGRSTILTEQKLAMLIKVERTANVMLTRVRSLIKARKATK